MGVRAESSSKCSLSSNNTTITQHMKMTMETSEEVSTRQDVKGMSIIIMLKGMEGAIWACASNQAQNAHFLPTTTTITQLLKMNMETSEEVSTGQEVI